MLSGPNRLEDPQHIGNRNVGNLTLAQRGEGIVSQCVDPLNSMLWVLAMR